MRSSVAIAAVGIAVGSLALGGCSPAPSRSPGSPGYQPLVSNDYLLGVQDAESGTAAAMVRAGVKLGDACKNSLKAENMFANEDEITGPDFYQGCLQRICELHDNGPNMFHPDYADACRTLASIHR